jgi:hypothetical protein
MMLGHKMSQPGDSTRGTYDGRGEKGMQFLESGTFLVSKQVNFNSVEI